MYFDCSLATRSGIRILGLGDQLSSAAPAFAEFHGVQRDFIRMEYERETEKNPEGNSSYLKSDPG